MIKCFLSHSSQDKEKYVDKVAASLRPEVTIIDNQNFEAGMSPLEEIMKGLGEASLFVLFLSEVALDSEWVKLELSVAKEKIEKGELKRIYPIIIDGNIDYSDPRIPQWLKDDYNLQHIVQYKIASRKINSRLREISWDLHPNLKSRANIFVGRNTQINNVEERIDDFSKSSPIVLVASGLNSIGRKSFINHALKKSNVLRESYEIPQILLGPSESIEDFILKVDDLGLVEGIDTLGLISKTVAEKVEISIRLVSNIIAEKEKILIEDNGCIVRYDGEVFDWFQSIVDGLKSNDYLVFCIASKFRPKKTLMFKNYSYYFEDISELEKNERNGLLLRYSKFKGLELSKDDLDFFSCLLTGYPEQVLYAVDNIANVGVFEAKKNSHKIQQYASDKAKIVLDDIKSDEHSLDFLYFLSKFDFISFDFLFSLVNEDEYYSIVDGFFQNSICERLGVNGEYLRVSDVIKDYITRGQFGIPERFKMLLEEHVKEFVTNYQDDNRDLSEYIFSTKTALANGDDIDEKFLIPSYFISTIKDLYSTRKYKEVIKLADRVLENESFIAQSVTAHIRFLKCQALARLKDPDFFGEVRNILEPEKSFLHGFYYRISGNYDRAITSFNSYLNRQPRDYRAKSELIQIFMKLDKYDDAYDLAKEVFENYPNNPININNYLSCLFFKGSSQVDIGIVQELVEKLHLAPSTRAQEMYLCAQAKFLAFFKQDLSSAISFLESESPKFPGVSYPLLTMADIAIHARDSQKLKFALDRLDGIETKNSSTHRSYQRFKSIYYAMMGQMTEVTECALKAFDSNEIEKRTQFVDRLPHYYKKESMGSDTVLKIKSKLY